MRNSLRKKLIAQCLIVVMFVTSIPTWAYATVGSNTLDSNMEIEEVVTRIGEDESLRGETTKHFLNSDGSYTVIDYLTPIHYKDEEGGEWKEIDNTLTCVTDGNNRNNSLFYVPKSSPIKTKITSDLNSEEHIRFQGEEHTIFWTYENTDGVSGKKKEFKDGATHKETSDKYALSKTLTDGIVFEGFSENTDLEVIVDTNGLKENIILKTKEAKTEYVIRYEIGELLAEEKDEHTIVLKNGNEVVFTIGAPYMKDASGNISEEVTLEILSQGETSVRLILKVDEDWIHDKERKFPITIDPYVMESTKNANYDASAIYNEDAIYPYGTLLVGNDNGAEYTKAKSYIKFELPELQPGDMVTGGNLYLAQCINTYGFSYVGSDEMQINVHKVTSSWTASNIIGSSSYNSLPGMDSTVVDYEKISQVDELTWVNFDISKVVKGWYEGESNYGICLVADDESQWALARFLATDCMDYENSRPYIAINYINNKGLEARWTYHEQNLGESGIGYINDYTGNLVYVTPLVETAGNIMPVSLSLVYNGYQKGETAGQITSVGKGFRLNIQQRIIPISSSGSTLEQKLYESGYRYVYEDSDGTSHYFYIKEDSSSIYIDEEGLGLELKEISTEDNLEKYQITSDAGGKLTFTASGYLRKAYDDNGNYYTIEYSETTTGDIAYIKDGVGRVIDITMDEDNMITEIKDPSERVVKITYTNGGEIDKIYYPDDTNISFSYSDEKLTGIKARDNIRVRYIYPQSGDVATKNRVIGVEEYSIQDDGSYGEDNLGNALRISYEGKNRTKFTDDDGLEEVFQFDNYGRTISVTDSEGGASSYKYTSGSLTNKKANRITSAASTSQHVNNLLKDHSLENGVSNWYLTSEGAEIVDDASWLGENSLKLTSANAYALQRYTAESGTFTFSAYVKTDSSDVLPKLRATFIDASGNVIERQESEPISRKVNWERTHVTFTVPENTAYFNVVCKIEGTGNAWFDCFQLEKGECLNAYNLVENSNFEDTSSTLWSGYNIDSNDGDGYYTNEDNGRCYRIYGDGDEYKRYSQIIPINRVANEVHFSVSGLGYGNSVPLSGSRRFGILIYTQFTDQTYTTSTVSFNPDYANDWQYASGTIGYSGSNASKTIDFITVRCLYYYNENWAGFDNIKVNLDESGTAYTYDDEGNLISSTDNAGRKETFSYNESGDITNVLTTDNKEYEYTYSDQYEHRLLSATSNSSNLKFSFGYDSNGNVTSNSVKYIQEDGTESDEYIKEVTNYTEDGNYVEYECDDRGYATNYTYDEVKGNLLEMEDRRGNVTSYSYAEDDDMLLGVSSGDTQVAYFYDDSNYLTGISTATTNYVFEYDEFGNLLETKVGDETLNTNVFEEGNGNLISNNYENGFIKNYTYDKYNRITSIGYNGTNNFFWSYNADGLIGRHYDGVLDKTYSYSYDLAGRLIRTDISDGSSIRVNYNDVDLGTDVHYYVKDAGARDIYYTYYDEDNLPKAINFGTGSKCQVTNEYDDLTRLTSRIYAPLNDGVEDISVEYSYLDWNSSNYPNRTTSTVNAISYTYTEGELTLSDRHYTYNKNGDITRERSGTSSSGEIREKYTYDELNQLTRHDSAVQNISYTYSYDASGNILEKKVYEYTTGTLGEAIETITYEYSDGNWKDQLICYDSELITYDQIGNMITFGEKNFTWQGRSLSTYTDGNISADYLYDANGIRTQKTVDGETTNYFLNGDQIIAQITGDDLMWFFYDSTGNRVALNHNGLCYYYMYNLQGDVIGLVRASTGKVAATYEYDAWGNCKVTNASGFSIGEDNPFRYRGYYYDSESDLYYVNSRYYDPEVGRFISADTTDILEVQSDLYDKNLYAYCDNNPIVRVDSTGAVWETVFDVGSLAASVIEVAINPTDVWAWASLAGDVVDLVPFVTGIGEAVRMAHVSSKANDVISAASTLRKSANKSVGVYEVTYASGKNYVGKGSFSRAVQSAKRYSNPHKLNGGKGDTVTSIRWRATKTNQRAFLEEYGLQTQRGVKNNWTYNLKWSPGKKSYLNSRSSCLSWKL